MGHRDRFYLVYSPKTIASGPLGPGAYFWYDESVAIKCENQSKDATFQFVNTFTTYVELVNWSYFSQNFLLCSENPHFCV